MSGITDWDTRFDSDSFFYGTTPTTFLIDSAGMIPRGARVLSIAEGEGRNAVWMAAARGCQVTAMDGSANALAKAARLADQAGVSVTFEQGDIANWDWGAAHYDLVVGCFFQFAPPALRDAIFAGMKQAVAPGGRLMLTGYEVKQLEYGTGGPRVAQMLYTEELLRDAFGDMTILRLAAYEKHLSEGVGHQGRSALIDLMQTSPPTRRTGASGLAQAPACADFLQQPPHAHPGNIGRGDRHITKQALQKPNPLRSTPGRGHSRAVRSPDGQNVRQKTTGCRDRLACRNG